eukprot:m.227507 g.227507  ORF g.227507 m.227507 type:complete len:481 (+) comp19244_c0_seq1:217-1659(+)
MPQYASLDQANATVDTGIYEVAETAASLSEPGILEFSTTAAKFQIDWGTYKQSQFLNDNEHRLLTNYLDCVKNKAAKDEYLESNGTDLCRVFLGLLSKVSKIETLQYLLTLIADMFADNADRAAKLFHQCAGPEGSAPSTQPLLRILSTKDDPYVVHQVNRVLVRLVSDGVEVLPHREQQVYFMWIVNEIKSKEKDASLLALESLAKLLRFKPYRRSFYEHGETIEALTHVVQLDPSVNIQAQYLTAYIAWVIAFEPSVASKICFDGSRFAADLADLLTATKKDKVTRMCLGFFVNLLTVPTSDEVRSRIAAVLVGMKLLTSVQSVLRGSLDTEAKADAEKLKTLLEDSSEKMSTFDEYANEVTSGRLEWSPVHRSAKFWRENAMRLNDSQHKLLKILVQLLETSNDPQVLAVAAHDIGQYVTSNPRGKSNIEKLKGKEQIMKLMHHDDQSVRYESLIAVQKLMTQNWSSLGKSIAVGSK